MTKQLLIGILATLLTLGFFGTAFASNLISSQSSEAGAYEFNFDTPMSKAEMAAENYNYKQERLSKVGTEAGVWNFNFDAPETKADIAAENHEYDQRTLSEVGTERGVLCTNC